MSKLKKILAAFLSAVMLLSTSAPLVAAAADAASSSGTADNRPFGSNGTVLELIDIDPSTLKVRKIGDTNQEEIELSDLDLSLDSIVRVSIFLDKPSAIDAGFEASEIAGNTRAVNYRSQLRSRQNTLTAEIEKKLGYSIDVKWNLTLLTNAVSAYVRVGDIPKIVLLNGVKSVEIENQFEPLSGTEAGILTANTTTQMTGASDAWLKGYTGAGSKIAIIDTGIDDDHISFDSTAFDYAIAELAADGKSVSLMTASDIPSNGLNGNGRYVNSKIPYAYNYIDKNTTIDHENANDKMGDHGSHVAGIAAANRYVRNGNSYEEAIESVRAVGMAPDAQLIIMKVFGVGGGAYDSDYFAALEDAIVLGCDSANLSLGSAAPGFTYSNDYQEILNKLSGSQNPGMIVSISAGNSYGFADVLKRDLYIDDVSMHTGGSPGTFINSLCVASADNTLVSGIPLVFNGNSNVFYYESTKDSEGNAYANPLLTTVKGSYDYVYIDATGESGDFSTVNGSVSLAGKIVIVNRGDISFSEKGNNAKNYNPKAVIVANNQDGVIYMNLSDYTGTFPMVTITLKDANQIKADSTEHTAGDIVFYTGSVTVTDTEVSEIMDRAEATISDFSSWGVPGSLLMKPEITAPGGDIYSVYGYGYDSSSGGWEGGSDKYVSFSGTSMAAPHVAGLAAILAQYMRENGFSAKNSALSSTYSNRAIMNSLLMSTATPMLNGGAYLPILQQGAGLADVSRAISSPSVVMVGPDDDNLTVRTGAAADGKVKIELGDDKDRTGKYTYTLTIYNLDDVDLAFDLATDVFTQGCYLDNEGNICMSSGTMPIVSDEEFVWEIIGTSESHDVNGDGKTDGNDAQALLDYITGKIDGSSLDLEAGEMDGTDGISSYDAYLLLNLNAGAYADGVVPAHGKRSVTVTFEIDEDWKTDIDEIYTSGAYIEAFTYVTCETAGYEHEHSVPVLGFYGSWTDPSMFDNIVNPYSGNSQTNYISIKYDDIATIFTGNPYCDEEEFPYPRLAVNSSSVFTKISYNLLRSAGTTGFAVSGIDEIGGDVTGVLSSSVTGNNVTGLYYHVNQGTWVNQQTQTYFVNKSASAYGLSEGDTFRIGYYAIPEYYAMLQNSDMTSKTAGVLGESGFRTLLEGNTLGRGAFVGYDFTVDDTAPVISSAVLNDDGTIAITASDNLNIAYIAVMSLDGETIYFEAVPGGSDNGTFVFDASDAIENAYGYVAVFAGDYAGNETAKAVKVNNNTHIEKTIFVLTDTVSEGNDYLIVSGNVQGTAYSLFYTLNTSGSTATVGANAVTVKPGDSNTNGRPYIETSYAAETSVWTAGNGSANGTFVFGNNGWYLRRSNTNELTITKDTSRRDWTWNGTNNRLSINSRYLRYYNNSFSINAASNSVYMYVKTLISYDVNPYSITAMHVSPGTLDIYKGSEAQLTAKVLPITVEDKSVTWTSSDASVATVDGSGKVTGISKGTATITATSNADDTIHDSCVVNVEAINKNLNAIIWDENGEVYFSSFNASTLPLWNKLHGDDKNMELHSAFMQSSSTLYAATLDTSSATSTLYTVDRSSYALTELGENYLFLTGMARASTSYTDYYVYCFGKYLIFGNIEPEEDDELGTFSGFPYGILDFSETTSGDVYIASVCARNIGTTSSSFYFLDETGKIWQTTMSIGSKVSFSKPALVTDTGISTSFLYQSLYYDGTWLYWSHCNEEVAELYIINPGTGVMYDAGNFGEGVWPAAGIYVNGSVAPGSAETGDAISVSESIRLIDDIDRETVNARLAAEAERISRDKKTAASSANGSLNYAKGTLKPVAGPISGVSEIMSAATGKTDTETYEVTVTYAADENDISNGLVRFTYDAEKMSYVSSSVLPDYASVNVDETNGSGIVTFAFAQKNGELFAMDETIITLTFRLSVCEESVSITVETLESGSSLGLIGQTEAVDIDPAEHTYTSEIIQEATYTSPGIRRYTCSHCGDTYDEEIPVLKIAALSASLTLSDSIDINFYVKDIASEAELNDIRVVYTFGGNETTACLNSRTSNHFVVASCSAKEIGDTVNFKLYYQDVLVREVNYSCRQYCENTIENETAAEQLKALCRAALDYGAYAQQYFGYKTDDLANATYTAGTVPDTVIPDSYNVQAAYGSISVISRMSVSLSLESKTELNFYFRTTNGTDLSDLTVKLKRGDVDGGEWEDVTDMVTLVQATGAYQLTVSGIAAKNLDKPQHISVSYVNENGETETKTVTYSPLTWACRQQENSDGNTANLAKALYNYYLGAAGCFGN